MYTNITHEVPKQQGKASIKGVNMWVGVWPQSEWFILDSPPGVTPQEVQFPCIVPEFQEYYNEKCMSHRHSYSCT